MKQPAFRGEDEHISFRLPRCVLARERRRGSQSLKTEFRPCRGIDYVSLRYVQRVCARFPLCTSPRTKEPIWQSPTPALH